jgi:spore maturation protein CgeB
MRILSTVSKCYAFRPNAVEPMFRWFTDPLHNLGHQVDHFDHVRLGREAGLEACGEAFVNKVKHGGYDLVLYQTGGNDFMSRNAIAEAREHAPVVAWNSDDDWQWDTYSKHIAPLFTFMATTYRHVYEENRFAFPNLRLSQWGCLATFADFDRPKNLDFTFAGQIYTNRVADCIHLKRKAGLKVFGLGSIRVRYPMLASRPVYRFIAQKLPSLNKPLEFEQVHDIWNRSRVSFAPMGSSTDINRLQVKGRVFEMGMSGTMMLSQRSPDIERFYEPGKEFIAYDSIEECAELAKFYLRNESERRRVAKAYYRRTRAEHLWEHRFGQLFRDIGMGEPAHRVTVRKVA